MAHRDAAHENEITPIHVHFRRMVRRLCTCAETYFSGPYVQYKRDTIRNSKSALKPPHWKSHVNGLCRNQTGQRALAVANRVAFVMNIRTRKVSFCTGTEPSDHSTEMHMYRRYFVFVCSVSMSHGLRKSFNSCVLTTSAQTDQQRRR